MRGALRPRSVSCVIPNASSAVKTFPRAYGSRASAS